MSSLIFCLLTFFFALLFLPLSNARAGTIFKFDPIFFTEERYDDNLFLTRSNTRSDWITNVSPGFFASLSNPRLNATVEYDAGFYYYLHNPDLDYTGHNLTFNGTAELTPRLSCSLFESYIRSNNTQQAELTGTDYERELRRDTRSIFNRKISAPALNYSFGRENLVRLYYRNTDYNTEDPAESDFVEQYIEGTLEYWFNVRHGMKLPVSFTKGNFDKDPDLLHGIEATPRYRYRFTQHLEVYGEYGYATSDFENERFFQTLENGTQIIIASVDREDFDTHKFNAGFLWELPYNLTIEGSMGYFWRYGVGNRDDQGILSTLDLQKRIRNLSFTVGWESGYSASYFSSLDSGFYKFWRISTGVNYTYQERLSWDINGSYGFYDYKDLRTSDVEEAVQFINEGREDYRYNFTTKLAYSLIKNYWYLSDLSLEVEYRFVELDSDLDTDYYINNQSAVRLTARF